MNDPADRKAFDTATNILSYHMMSRQALFERLLQKGIPEDKAQNAVDKLQELRVLDDAAYAERMAHYCRSKGYGAGRLRRMLKEKKVEQNAAEAALAAFEPNDDKAQDLIRVAFKGQVPDRAAIKKVSDKLFRLGYSWDEISRYIGEYKETWAEAEDAI